MEGEKAEVSSLGIPDKIICYICRKEDRPATPLFQAWCPECYHLYRASQNPKTSTLGHPANQSYYREKNYSVIEIWENHLKKHGFVKKWGNWRRKKVKPK